MNVATAYQSTPGLTALAASPAEPVRSDVGLSVSAAQAGELSGCESIFFSRENAESHAILTATLQASVQHAHEHNSRPTPAEAKKTSPGLSPRIGAQEQPVPPHLLPLAVEVGNQSQTGPLAAAEEEERTTLLLNRESVPHQSPTVEPLTNASITSLHPYLDIVDAAEHPTSASAHIQFGVSPPTLAVASQLADTTTIQGSHPPHPEFDHNNVTGEVSLAAQHHAKLQQRDHLQPAPPLADGSTSVAVVPEAAPYPGPQQQQHIHSTTGTPWGLMLFPLLKIAIPSMVSYFFLFASQSVTMGFVGHRMGFDALAGFSVAVSVFNILAGATGLGFAGAIDTVAPQQFGRDQNASLVPIYLRSQVCNVGLLVPVSLAFLASEPALKRIYGNDLGEGAYAFLKYCAPYAYLVWHSSNLTRLLAAQRLADIGLYANVAGTFVSCALSYLFLSKQSTMFSVLVIVCLTQVSISMILLLACVFHPESRLKELRSIFVGCCTGRASGAVVETASPNTPSTDGSPTTSEGPLDQSQLRQHAYLGFHACVSLCASWWGFEVLQMISAQLSEVDVTAFTIILNVMTIYYSIAGGVAIGGGTLLGNALGAGEPHLAQRYLLLTAKVLLGATALSVASLCFFGRQVFSFYTTDAALMAVLVPMAPLVGVWHFFDAVQTLMLQLHMRVGKQHRASVILLPCMWLLGIPCALFSIKGLSLGLSGIIGGQLVGVLALVVLLMREIRRWDFSALATEQLQAGDPPAGSGGTDQSAAVDQELQAVDAPRHSTVAGHEVIIQLNSAPGGPSEPSATHTAVMAATTALTAVSYPDEAETVLPSVTRTVARHRGER